MGLYRDGRYYKEAPWKTCGGCGARYQITDQWRNHFLCSVGCCQKRLHERNPPPEVGSYENYDDYEYDRREWERRFCLPF